MKKTPKNLILSKEKIFNFFKYKNKQVLKNLGLAPKTNINKNSKTRGSLTIAQDTILYWIAIMKLPCCPSLEKDKALRVRVFWSLSLTHWSLKDSTGVFMSF